MRNMNTRATIFLLGTVFITGAAVLVIEVAAVRVLSPYFGSSLYVFSSVLTIILGALSLGYYYGGRLADRMPFPAPLYGIITVSGLLTLLAQLLVERVLPFSGNVFSVLSGPLIFGTLLFFAPAFLLGIVSPYLVKLVSLVANPESIGRTAGTVFFWGTIGSIIGSLLTGFLLIPLLGLRHSLVGTGCVLFVLGISGLLMYERIHKGTSVFITVARHSLFLALSLTAAIILITLIYRSVFPFPYTVLYRSDGVYGHIIVYEVKASGLTYRALKRDTNNESAVILESYHLPFEYTQFAPWYRTLVPEAKRFLMIGGGAFSVPRTLLATDPNLEISVVDIEPDLYPLARQYFDLPESERLHNYVMDGRVFLNTNEKPFDVIMLDAFGTDLTLPSHLATKEFFETIKANLSPEGVLIINYIGTLKSESSPSLTGSLTKTLASVFPVFEMYGLSAENPSDRQNIVYVLRNGTSTINLDDKTILAQNGTKVSVRDVRVSPAPYLIPKELIFTDDKAPIEYLMLEQYE